MPEHVLMSDIEIITDGGPRPRWSTAEKLRIVEETHSEFKKDVESPQPLILDGLLQRCILTVHGSSAYFCSTKLRQCHR